VDATVVIGVIVFILLEMHAVRFNKTLNWSLPTGTLEEGVNGIKHPGANVILFLLH